MLDIVWTGGITEAVKIAALADTYHLAVTPHDCTGPVNVFASLHLCAAAQNAMIQEAVRGFYEGYYLDVLTRPLPIREGHATFDLGPGIGASYARTCCPGPPAPASLRRIAAPVVRPDWPTTCSASRIAAPWIPCECPRSRGMAGWHGFRRGSSGVLSSTCRE